MAAYKYSMIFQYLSGAGTGGDLNLKAGWSESFYSLLADDAKKAQFRLSAQLRAVLLPLRSYVSGIRIQPVDPSGPAQTFAVNFPGGGGASLYEQDIPQMALLIRMRGSAVTNVRSYRMVAVPDIQVFQGEFKPLARYRAALNPYLSSLQNFSFRATDLTRPQLQLVSVAADGTYVVSSDLVAPVGTLLKFKNLQDASKRPVRGGTFKVITATTLRTGVVQRWDRGIITSGNVQLAPIIYPPILVNADDISRVVTRKVGRPSLGYRGRRSKRRA